MSLLAIDLGGTKLSLALFSEDGGIKLKETVALNGRTGDSVGELITQELIPFLNIGSIKAIGVAVPGISSKKTGTVWAPNIPGWTEYPLYHQLKKLAGEIPVVIESDRACYISGEVWNGNAKGCTDAIFLAVGTGIGAGIMMDGKILHGAQDIAGSIGWMALKPAFEEKYVACGCFEYHASGEGVARLARQRMTSEYNGELKNVNRLSAHDVFAAYDNNDPFAVEVINECILFWGMATANLVSLFNPQKILFGGGVFGPAQKFIPEIKKEAAKWAQPVSMRHVNFESSLLGTDAGLHGAAYLALQSVSSKTMNDAA